MKKKFLATLALIAVLLMATPFASIVSASAVDGLKGSGGELEADIPILKNGMNIVSVLLQFGYFAVVAWTSLKFMQNKQYGQFWGFLILAIIVYILIFQPTALDLFAKSLGGLLS
ncbi:hypothetical protein D3C78_18360 [compost metagenome]